MGWPEQCFRTTGAGQAPANQMTGGRLAGSAIALAILGAKPVDSPMEPAMIEQYFMKSRREIPPSRALMSLKWSVSMSPPCIVWQAQRENNRLQL